MLVEGAYLLMNPLEGYIPVLQVLINPSEARCTVVVPAPCREAFMVPEFRESVLAAIRNTLETFAKPQDDWGPDVQTFHVGDES